MTETAARLAVVLDARIGQFEANVRRAESRLQRSTVTMRREAMTTERALDGVGKAFARAFVAPLASAASIEGLRRIASNALQAADALDKMAISADLPVERLQTLRFAFQQTGVGADEGGQALARFSRRLGEFRNSGAGPASEALRQLRLDAAVLNGELPTTEAALDAVLRQLSKVENTGQQAALAAKLFGDEMGRKFVRAMQNGADGIADLEQQARDLGLVLDRELIDKSVEIGDRWAATTDRMSLQFKAMALEVIALSERVFNALSSMMPGPLSASDLRGISDEDLDARIARAQAFRARVGDNAGSRTMLDMLMTERDRRNNPASPPRDFGAPDLTPRASSSRAGGRSAPQRDAFAEAAARYREAMWAIRDEADVLPKGEAAMRAFQREARVTALQLDLLRVVQRDGTAATAEQVAEIRDLADAYGDALERLDRAREATEAKAKAERDAARAAEEHAREMDRVADAIAGSIAQARSFKDALRGVAQQLAQMAIRGAFGGGPLGGVLGGIGASIFGGGGGVTTGTPLTLATAQLPKLADGARNFSGGLAMVGERGRELVNLPRGSQVIPNGRTEAMLRGGRLVIGLEPGLKVQFLDEAARQSVTISEQAVAGLVDAQRESRVIR